MQRSVEACLGLGRPFGYSTAGYSRYIHHHLISPNDFVTAATTKAITNFRHDVVHANDNFAVRAARGAGRVLQARESATEPEPPEPNTASLPSSSSCSPSESSSGHAETDLALPGAKTDAASPGRERPEAGRVVV